MRDLKNDKGSLQAYLSNFAKDILNPLFFSFFYSINLILASWCKIIITERYKKNGMKL